MGDPRPRRSPQSVFKGVVENRDGSSIAAEGMSAANYSMRKKTTKMAKGVLGSLLNYNNVTSAVESVRPRGPRGVVVSEGDKAIRIAPTGLKARISSYNPNTAGGKGTGTRKVAKAMPMPMSTPAMSSMASRPMPPQMPPKMPSPAPSMMRPNPATPMRPAMGGTGMSSMYKGKKMAKADSSGQGAYINGRPAQINKRSK